MVLGGCHEVDRGLEFFPFDFLIFYFDFIFFWEKMLYSKIIFMETQLV